MTVAKQYIIFTDLDGTLLDHHTYSYDEAVEAIEKIKCFEIPLILASSKTAAELISLRAELDFEHCPAIVENGAGILKANETQTSKSDSYGEILEKINAASDDLSDLFKGFSNWSADEIAEITSLTPEAATLAKQRQFSEPGLWKGSDMQLSEFESHLAKQGLKAQQGGRFLTVSSGHSKADRMVEIINERRKTTPDLISVALGDAPNDFEMLSKSDIGFLINNPTHQFALPPELESRIKCSQNIGPAGWNESILGLI